LHFAFKNYLLSVSGVTSDDSAKAFSITPSPQTKNHRNPIRGKFPLRVGEMILRVGDPISPVGG
jgi:hypothetical protein